MTIALFNAPNWKLTYVVMKSTEDKSCLRFLHNIRCITPDRTNCMSSCGTYHSHSNLSTTRNNRGAKQYGGTNIGFHGGTLESFRMLDQKLGQIFVSILNE